MTTNNNDTDNGLLFSEILLYLRGDSDFDFSELLTEAENATEEPELCKPLFDKCMDLSGDISLNDGRITEGPWAYGLKGNDDNGKPYEFTKLYRNEDGFALSFCYEKDILVLERFFWKED